MALSMRKDAKLAVPSRMNVRTRVATMIQTEIVGVAGYAGNHLVCSLPAIERRGREEENQRRTTTNQAMEAADV
jgi:hypothetical protein